jgi:hypothetical protein
VGGNGGKGRLNERVSLRVRQAEQQGAIQARDYSCKKGAANERDGNEVVSSKMCKNQLQNIKIHVVSGYHRVSLSRLYRLAKAPSRVVERKRSVTCEKNVVLFGWALSLEEELKLYFYP